MVTGNIDFSEAISLLQRTGSGENQQIVRQNRKPSASYDVHRLFDKDNTVERQIIEHLKGVRASF